MMNDQSASEFGLSWAQSRVRAFHEAAGHPVGQLPALLRAERLRRRIDWMQEELDELGVAATVVDQADAIIDLMYFALGTLVEMGLEGEPLFDIVHKANMRKITAAGVTTRPHDGKIQKPDGWVTPESEIASSLVSSYSRFRLVPADKGESCAAVLEMIAHAVGIDEWSKQDFHRSLPPLGGTSDGSNLPLDTVEPFLSAAAAPLKEVFIPIETINEATFHQVLQQSLSAYPGVFVAFQSKQVYPFADSAVRYALVDKMQGDVVQIIDPDSENPGIHAVNVDDLFAGVKSAMDGVHRVNMREQ